MNGGADSPDSGINKDKEQLIHEEIESLAEDGNLDVAYKSVKMTNQ